MIYTTGTAAKELGVRSETVRRWINSGKLKSFVTPGGHRRISADEIERLKQTGTSRG